MKKVFALLLTVCLTLGVLPVYSSAASETEDNDSFAAAQRVSVNEAISGNISDGKDRDYFAFTLEKDGYVNLSFHHEYEDTSSSLWDITLFDSSYKEIVQKQAKGQDIKNDYDPVGLPAGNYYVEVAPYNSYNSSTAAYELTVHYAASSQWETEQNDAFSTADPIAVNQTVHGSILHGKDEDFYQFSLPEDGYISIQFGHENIDNSSPFWKFGLYNDECESVTSYNAMGNAPAAKPMKLACQREATI